MHQSTSESSFQDQDIKRKLDNLQKLFDEDDENKKVEKIQKMWER